MRAYLLAAAAIGTLAMPAQAQNSGPYFGVEGGVLLPKDQNGSFNSTFTQSVQSPAAGTVAAAPGVGRVGVLPTTLTTVPTAINGGADLDYKRGYDVGGVLGYDFGFFRLEGEVAYKRAKFDGFDQDATFVTGVTTGLTPTGTTGTAFAFPVGNLDSFNLGRRTTVLSGMANALVDLDIGGGGLYAGGGVGRARVKMFGDRDTSWAYQGIAGFRLPISDNIDVGVKYRYFRTRRLDLVPGATTFTASRTVAVPNVAAADGTAGSGTTNVNFTRTAALTGDFNDRFSSHSLLLTLGFNFGGRSAERLPPPPPPAVMAPPPPPPPETQTCPDGSVVLATDACPVPPPPPPPPAAAPERG